MTRVLMLQGTGSNVGKSILTAGLCRAFHRRGLRVAPFKPQNMSNNAAVTPEGGEIGRAQALQARAAGLAPSVHMNPILLKPETDRGSQVVVQGFARGSLQSGAWRERKTCFLAPILESFERICRDRDLVLIEGAGSPAETNLRAGDVANMGFAEAAGVPVALIGDIDRGGVIASLIGTHAVLSSSDRARIRGFLINKFRGDPELFADGISSITDHTGWRMLGIVPWLSVAARLPDEDAVPLDQRPRKTDGRKRIHIAVPMLSRIANFDDLDPLRAEPDVTVEFVPPGRPLPLDADAVILPGTKATLGDLAMLREQGWDIDVLALARAGAHILGLCGGFQMLGQTIEDPLGVDGRAGSADGLGLLATRTVMAPAKTLKLAEGFAPDYGAAVRGYEIHMGHTEGPDCARPMLVLSGAPDGARSADGCIEGTYLHGLFHADDFRRAWLAKLGAAAGAPVAFEASIDDALDRLADGLENALDIEAVLALAEAPGWAPKL